MPSSGHFDMGLGAGEPLTGSFLTPTQRSVERDKQPVLCCRKVLIERGFDRTEARSCKIHIRVGIPLHRSKRPTS